MTNASIYLAAKRQQRAAQASALQDASSAASQSKKALKVAYRTRPPNFISGDTLCTQSKPAASCCRQSAAHQRTQLQPSLSESCRSPEPLPPVVADQTARRSSSRAASLNSKKTMAVVVVGSANVDLVVNSPRFPKPGETLIGSRFEQLFGGKGANQAAAAALLGSPVRVVMRVGRDDLGQATRKNFERLGIDSKHVSDSKDAATGVALITVDSNGENTIVVASGANAKLTPEDVAETVFDGAAVVLTQLEVPVSTNIAALRKAKAKKVLTVFNAAPAPTNLYRTSLWALCDVLCVNEPELQLLTGRKVENDSEACGELLKRGVGAVLLTRGRRGCLLARKEGSISVGVPETLRNTPVDTTGAGDALFRRSGPSDRERDRRWKLPYQAPWKWRRRPSRRRGAQASYPTAADLGWAKRPPAPPSPTRFGDTRDGRR